MSGRWRGRGRAHHPAPPHADLQWAVPAGRGHAAGLHVRVRGARPDHVGRQAVGATSVDDGREELKGQCGKVMAAYKKRQLPAAEKGLFSKCEQGFTQGVKVGATSQRDVAVHQLLLYSLVGLGLMGVASGVVGWLVAGRALRPVHAITGAARRASEENLGERLALTGPGRRAQGTGRHVRRDAGPAGRGVRQPAPVRRQRLARAAHPADRDAHRHRCHAGQAGPDPGPAGRDGR